MLTSRFQTKKSLSNQNLPYIILKISFPLQIHFQLPQIIILKLSVNLLSCSSAHFAVFKFLPQVLPLALATLLNIVSSSLRVCNGLLFPRNLDPSSLTSGNLDPLSLTPGGSIVPLVCGFRR